MSQFHKEILLYVQKEDVCKIDIFVLYRKQDHQISSLRLLKGRNDTS